MIKEWNFQWIFFFLYSFILDILLLNGSRAMIDLEENDKKFIENDEQNPNIIICEVTFI